MKKPHPRIKALRPSSDEHYALLKKVRIRIIRNAAKRKDILTWARYLFPDKFTLPFCMELHSYFLSIRLDPLTSTEAPRGHAKTLIKCFLIPIFQALEEPAAFRHYLNVQATEEKALTVNRAIKLEIEENELLREIYGDQRGERWTDQQFVLSNGVIFTTISAGQSIRGINYRNLRPDYIVVDDLYNEEDIYNAESTEKKNNWVWSSLYPARAKSRVNSFHIQGTAINTYDILHQLKKNTQFKTATFRAIKDEKERVVLWPELNTFESLMIDKENMGSHIFYRENAKRAPRRGGHDRKKLLAGWLGVRPGCGEIRRPLPNRVGVDRLRSIDRRIRAVGFHRDRARGQDPLRRRQR